MVKLRSAAFIAACVVLITVSVACGGRQVPEPGSPPLGQGLLFSQMAPNAKGCGGTGRVKVRPCPVTITKTHSMPIVFVSGPNVTDSAFVETACEKKDICSLGQFTSNPLEWYVYPLTKCGSADIYAYGYNAGGGTVGIGYLRVINKDCSSRQFR
jgi:hypothetical protein